MYRLFLLLLLLAVIASSVLGQEIAPRYHFIRVDHLGTPFSLGSNAAMALNDRNEIVFNAVFFVGPIPPELGTMSEIQAIVWRKGYLDTLDHPAGYTTSGNPVANGGNISAAGTWRYGSSPEHIHGFTNSVGSGSTDLSVLPQPEGTHPNESACLYCFVHDVSENGYIAGTCGDGTGLFNKFDRGVVWDGGEPQIIGYPDGESETTVRYHRILVNNDRQIAGYLNVTSGPEAGSEKAFFGSVSALSYVETDSVVQHIRLFSLNNEGVATGYQAGTFASLSTKHAVRVDNGVVTDLNAAAGLDPDQFSWGYNVNDSGYVVGYTIQGGSRAVMWGDSSNTTIMHDLRSLVETGDNVPTALTSAWDINNQGVILGAYSSGSYIYPYLLIPILTGPNKVIVNSVGDAPDSDLGDGKAWTGDFTPLGEEEVTLRSAIQHANQNPGVDTICFRIMHAEPTIFLDSLMTPVLDQVMIDGATQVHTGHEHVRVSGFLDTLETNFGLNIAANASRLIGLTFDSFGGSGLLINADSVIVEQCNFGTDTAGTSGLGNGSFGIWINGSYNRIGEIGLPQKMCRIHNNSEAGILVLAGEKNILGGNSLIGNGGLGIDLAPTGFNPNDTGDEDLGANTLLNSAVIDSVVGGILYGTLPGVAGNTYVIEVYRSDYCHPSGYGEGQEPLFTHLTTAAGSGLASFSFSVAGFPLGGSQVYSLLVHDNDNTSEFSNCWPATTVKLLDGDGRPIANRSDIDVYKVANDPPTMTRTLLGQVVTNSEGVVEVFQDWIRDGTVEVGDSLQFEIVLPSVPFTTPPPIALNRYRMRLDNAGFDPASYDMVFDTLENTVLQEIALDHTTIALNLIVSVEWRASDFYLDELGAAFRNLTNLLYDATDGQLYLDTVIIGTNREFWTDPATSFVIRARNDYGITRDYSSAWGFSKYGTSPRYFGLSRLGEAPDLSWAEFPRPANTFEHWHALAKLVGLSQLGMRFDRRSLNHSSSCDIPVIGILDQNLYDFPNDLATSEISTAYQLDYGGCRAYSGYHSHGSSGWKSFETRFQGEYDGLWAEIKRPVEQSSESLTDHWFVGPNDPLTGINYDVERFIDFPYPRAGHDAWDVVITLFNSESGSPIGRERVYIVNQYNPSLQLHELRGYAAGKTATTGQIYLPGVDENSGYVILETQLPVIDNKSAAGDEFHYAWSAGPLSDTAGDTLTVIPIVMQGTYPMLFDIDQTGGSEFTISARYESKLPGNPVYDYFDTAGQAQSVGVSDDGSSYLASFDVFSAEDEYFLTVVDDSGSSFPIVLPAFVTEIVFSEAIVELSSNDGRASFEIDSGAVAVDTLAVMESDFPPLTNGLTGNSYRVSKTYSIDSRVMDNVSGQLSIIYDDARFIAGTKSAGGEETIHIHVWDKSTSEWQLLPGMLDTTSNRITAEITGNGTYGAFTSDISTDIAETPYELPLVFELEQNYPNPFNPTTTINFSLPQRSSVTIDVWNVIGQRVRRLLSEILPAGNHSVVWDGRSYSGDRVASGVYFYRLRSDNNTVVRKMLLLK